MYKINLGQVRGPLGEPGITQDISHLATKDELNIVKNDIVTIQNEINGVNTALTEVIGKEI